MIYKFLPHTVRTGINIFKKNHSFFFFFFTIITPSLLADKLPSLFLFVEDSYSEVVSVGASAGGGKGGGAQGVG